MKKTFLLIAVLIFPAWLTAQNYKYGKVSKAELMEKSYPGDSTAPAAILYTSRYSYFDFDTDHGFRIVENYYTRMKIYSKEGFEKATKRIKTYFQNAKLKEYVNGIKGTTYNLVNGKVVKTKLSKDAIYKERLNEHYYEYKFTMPNLKPGSVVEWKYTLTSPFFGMLDEVVLQEDIPIKKLETEIRIPEYFHYNTRIKGYLPPPRIITGNRLRNISAVYHGTRNQTGGFQFENGKVNLDFEEIIYKINMSNVPAIRKEPYAGNINNYKAGVVFELSYVQFENSPLIPLALSWEKIAEKLMEDADFGGQLNKNKHFKQDLDPLLSDDQTPEEKLMIIYDFVKNQIKWNGWRSFQTYKGLAKAYREHRGNVADINLNLVAMLRYAGLDAEPVLVSTIENGIPLFPSIFGFDYVIAKVNLDDGSVLLDATEKFALPNILPERTMNFRGMSIGDNGKTAWVRLYPTQPSLEHYVINARLTGDEIEGISRKTITRNLLLRYRKRYAGKPEKDIIKSLEKEYDHIDIQRLRISHLEDLSQNAVETIQFTSDFHTETIGDKIYLSPLLFLTRTENPFKSDKRTYPVFYNIPWITSAVINIQIPENYTVESLPADAEFSMPEHLGKFKYSISVNGQTIQIKYMMSINEPVIEATRYPDLKTFYQKIIDKNKEKIVLKKK